MITVIPQPPTNITVTPSGSTSITFSSPEVINVEVAAAVIIRESVAGSLPSLPVAQNISALRIVSNINGLYDYANPLDPIDSWSIAGIAMQSINSGGLCSPVNNQPVTDSLWNWARGSPVFLGPQGTLTQTPPSTGNLVVVARVLDSKTIFIHIENPIVL
jgi:hypothetical protein